MDDVSRSAWVEVKNHHRWTRYIIFARQRRVQLEVGEISSPYERWEIVSEAIMHYSLVAFAPHLGRLNPFGPMRWTILFVKKFALHAVRVPLHRERTIP
jgi:hypothetical protein